MTSGRRIEIEAIKPNSVEVFGQVIWRPDRVSPSQWLRYWESLVRRELEPTS